MSQRGHAFSEHFLNLAKDPSNQVVEYPHLVFDPKLDKNVIRYTFDRYPNRLSHSYSDQYYDDSQSDQHYNELTDLKNSVIKEKRDKESCLIEKENLSRKLVESEQAYNSLNTLLIALQNSYQMTRNELAKIFMDNSQTDSNTINSIISSLENLTNTIEQIEEIYKKYLSQNEAAKIEIDGLKKKVNDLEKELADKIKQEEDDLKQYFLRILEENKARYNH